MNRLLIFLTLFLVAYSQSFAFCGFYVAKADAKLFNKSSQIIIVRDGDHTVITMSNDFSGDVKDFAMVVPVPEVLKESDIRIVQQFVFDKMDAYTAPRMVEYYDPTPCPRYVKSELYLDRTDDVPSMAAGNSKMDRDEDLKKDYKVTIEATYTVGEYDILILGAEESDGLKRWLTDNGYKLPENADEALDPYIRDKMKFFVVKVNLDKQKESGFTTLRPIQIQFNSSRFMLPIRLGMANAESEQDLVIYAFTRNGRVETSNYRTAMIPTDRDIPEFVMEKDLFGPFYKDVFAKSWKHEGRNAVMLEYAWDVSATQPVKCDPCVTPPITFAELREAGVWWIQPNQWSGSYSGELFVTRLHARYSREKFPQDLMFTITPNKKTFQGRYVIRHPAQGDMDCPEGKAYMKALKDRKRKELEELAVLTGWSTSKYYWYLGENGSEDEPGIIIPEEKPEQKVAGGEEADLEEGMTASADEGDAAAGYVVPDEDTMIRESEDFLKEAIVNEHAGINISTNFVLFGFAVLVFISALFFRKRMT